LFASRNTSPKTIINQRECIGIEQPPKTSEKLHFPQQHSAESDAPAPIDPDLVRIIQSWPTLQPALKSAITAIISTATPAPLSNPQQQKDDHEHEGPHPAYGS
jgi:hypothetical protein